MEYASYLIWEEIQGLTLVSSKETMKKKRKGDQPRCGSKETIKKKEKETNRDGALVSVGYSRVFQPGLKMDYFSRFATRE